MQSHLDQQIFKWLNQLKIAVSFNYLKKELRSHPDYPSLSSITDTLDQLGIENAALVVDTERMNELPLPFLAHTNKSGGEFVIVRKISTFNNSESNDYKNWNGVVIVAEKPEAFSNKENEEWLHKEKRSGYSMALVIALVIAISGLTLVAQFSWILLGLVLSGLTGLFVAILILLHELGHYSPLADQLCGIGKNTDCDAVMKSKGTTFIEGFNWADAGIIYFVATLLLLLASSLTNTITGLNSILAIFSVCSLPFTFYSLYYQKQVVKKWCTLCLLTVGLLWVQAALFLPTLVRLDTSSINLTSVTLLIVVLSFVSGVWFLLVKPLLNKEKKLTSENYSLLRFKNNPSIFESLLKQQREVSVTPFADDLQLGNPYAKIQIMMACNPYCGPCAIAHEDLVKLLERADIGLTVRFTIKTENKEDKKIIAVKYLFQLLKGSNNQYKRQVLHDWYSLMNFKSFSEKYALTEFPNVDDQLLENEQWSEESKIKGTPTIFINGYEMPKQYKISDLPGCITRLKNEIVQSYQENKSPQVKLFIAQ